MIAANQLHSDAPVQLLAERSCGTSLLRRGFGSESDMVKIQVGGHTRGSHIRGYAIVDDEDGDLDKIKWGISFRGKCRYATNSSAGLMHRNVLERKIGRPIAPNEVTDHINGDGLDNRRANLRAVSQAANVQNSRRAKTNTSGHRGVHFDRDRGKWRVQVYVNGKCYKFGRYRDLLDAANAAKAARAKLGFSTEAYDHE